MPEEHPIRTRVEVYRAAADQANEQYQFYRRCPRRQGFKEQAEKWRILRDGWIAAARQIEKERARHA